MNQIADELAEALPAYILGVDTILCESCADEWAEANAEDSPDGPEPCDELEPDETCCCCGRSLLPAQRG